MFEMDECPLCHRSKSTVLNQPDVQDCFRDHGLILPVDVEGAIEITDLRGGTTTMKDIAFEQHRERATRVFAFSDLDGTFIKPARHGGSILILCEMDECPLCLLGHYVVGGEYQDQPLTRYKRAARLHVAQRYGA